MSKAYYYVKNFSFKEVNNLFSYSVKDPSHLSGHQKITRLYKGVVRKLMAMHFYTVKRVDYEQFLEESRKARLDFETIRNSKDAREVDAMLAKYEQFIEDNFEPYAAMHECRPHSNLAGKMLLYSNAALMTDHVGWYSKNRLVTGEPSNDYTFHEEYPHMVSGWIYEDLHANEEFDFADDIDGDNSVEKDAETLKKAIDSTK